MTVTKAGGGWKNGQKVGETWKIALLEVWMWTDQDNIARIKSYKPGMLCKTSSGVCGSAQPAQGMRGMSTSTMRGGVQGGGKGGNDLLNEGRGLLDRVSKP